MSSELKPKVSQSLHQDRKAKVDLVTPPALSISNISKIYRIFPKPEDRLKQMFLGRWKTYYRDFWALKSVSFEVPRGSAFGVIGSNGSGKSTLLQIIAGILAPSTGGCARRGRVSALIELGSGFNPEFSGRDNAQLQCVLLGLDPKATELALPKILEFSELESFFERPVKTYSSGMIVRLGFACQAVLEPEILLADEVLAVGDAHFQWKCFAKIRELKDRGTTILLVTHDTTAVQNLCDRVLWLNTGEVWRCGENVADIVAEYLDFQRSRGKEKLAEPAQLVGVATTKPQGETDSEIGSVLAVILSDKNGARKHAFARGDFLKIRIQYVLAKNVPGCVLGVAIFDAAKQMIVGLNTMLDKAPIGDGKGQHELELHLPSLQFCNGAFSIDVGLFDEQGMARADYKSTVAVLQINGENNGLGILVPDHAWHVKG